MLPAMLAFAGIAFAQDGAIPDTGFEEAFPKLRIHRVVAIAHPPDGTDRLFVLEQKGRVVWFENTPDAAETVVAIDLTPKVLSRGNEEGLLGIAFHPKFKANHQMFLQYSSPPGVPKNQPRVNILSRFTMDPEHRKILPDSEQKILEIAQPFENHNGGVLQFGPDGFLYIGLGDGGMANDPQGNGQKLDALLGKFLRIDVDSTAPGLAYGIPKDNPFVGKEGVRPEIWSLGWRNPWGYHFDRKTGELWSGDVGQDLWEEINVVVKGGNYGWNVRESMHPFEKGFRHKEAKGPFVEPVVEHSHDPKVAPGGHIAKSITGGCVYRGKKMPALDGVYLYGDFVEGHMWGLRARDGKLAQLKELFTLLPHKQISIFGEDRDGEVYFATFGAGEGNGRIYRFVLK